MATKPKGTDAPPMLVYVPRELRQRLRIAAIVSSLTMSALTIRAVAELLDRLEAEGAAPAAEVAG